MFFLATVSLVLVSGCTPGAKEPIEICLGKKTLHDAIVVLKSQRENIGPVRAGGNCRITWFDEKGKSHDENPTINIRFIPPDKLYLKGDVLGSEVFL